MFKIRVVTLIDTVAAIFVSQIIPTISTAVLNPHSPNKNSLTYYSGWREYQFWIITPISRNYSVKSETCNKLGKFLLALTFLTEDQTWEADIELNRQSLIKESLKSYSWRIKLKHRKNQSDPCYPWPVKEQTLSIVKLPCTYHLTVQYLN